MSEDIFTYTDTDNSKIKKITRLLPKKDFDNFLYSLGLNALYFAEENRKIDTVINLSKGAFSQFDNNLINEKYLKFNTALSNLYTFLLNSFSIDEKDVRRVKLHPEWKHSIYDDVKKWYSKYDELQALISATKNAYESFLISAKKELEMKQTNSTPKLLLSDYEVTFDDETAKLKLGTFYSVDLPPYKNEHYLLRKMFAVQKDEAIDWEEVYEAMNGSNTATRGRKDPEKCKKSVQDTVRAVNTRVQKILKTDSQLLSWEIKCVKRLY